LCVRAKIIGNKIIIPYSVTAKVTIQDLRLPDLRARMLFTRLRTRAVMFVIKSRSRSVTFFGRSEDAKLDLKLDRNRIFYSPPNHDIPSAGMFLQVGQNGSQGSSYITTGITYMIFSRGLCRCCINFASTCAASRKYQEKHS